MPRSAKKKPARHSPPRSSERIPNSASRSPFPAGVISSTDAQNNFGLVLSQAEQEGSVVITKYGTKVAVVLSVDRYRELVPSREPNLDELSREFDEMVARMQTPEAAVAADTVFTMSPEELAEVAVASAENRESA